MDKGMKRLLCAVIMLVGSPGITGCATKHAVLLSSNETLYDDMAYHSEWWYDLILQYKTLKDNGFKDDNIHVVYGDGSDFSTSHPEYDATALFGHGITDMAMTKANVEAVFTNLNPDVRKNDFLDVWWMGHGSGYGADRCDLTMHLSNTGETITDVELRSYIEQVSQYRKRSINIMTCHSGGLLDNFAIDDEKTITLASSTCVESSYDATSTCDNIYHAEFNYTFPNALQGRDFCGSGIPSDTDGNLKVSLNEAHRYNLSAMTRSTPQIVDPDRIAGCTLIKEHRP